MMIPTLHSSVGGVCLALIILIVNLCSSHGLATTGATGPRPLFVEQVKQWLTDQGVPHHEVVLKVSSSSSSVSSLSVSSTSREPVTAAWLVELPVDQNTTLALNLLSTPGSLLECVPPRHAMALTNNNSKYSKIIHLHQDVWQAKPDIVHCRLLAQLGRTSCSRIFARKTTARRIPAGLAVSFLQQHHLWGATKAKYSYGLFANTNINSKGEDDDELVAVATFSSRRKVLRLGHAFRSHELLRFCTQRNVTVVGGISKLLKCFVRDQNPDDVVTVVDRDWGDGSGWHSVGFATVTTMDPLVMAVHPNEPGIRRHLVGAGIRPDNPDMQRLGLPLSICEELNQVGITAHQARAVLAEHNYYLVHDAGVERLFRIVNDTLTKHATGECSVMDWWNGSEPKYIEEYYSNNAGIRALLSEAATVIDDDEHLISKRLHHKNVNYDGYLASWRASSGSTTTSAAKLVFSAPSSLDPQATVEVRERGDGWRTLGIAGGVTKSIYHAVYKVDPYTGNIEPRAVVADYIKIMSESFLAVMKEREILPKPTPLRMLHLGLGAGTLMRLLSHELLHVPAGCDHVAVESDSGVVAAMNAMLPPPLHNTVVFTSDALTILRDPKFREEDSFDGIFVDIFDKNNLLPPSFYSTEYLSHLRDDVLKSTGLVMFNLHCGGKKRQRVVDEAHAAMKQVFSSVHIIQARDCQPNGGNSVLIGSMADLIALEEDLIKNGGHQLPMASAIRR